MAGRESHDVPTLRELCRVLGDDLAPVEPRQAPAVEVSAVHVSELADPTQYLDGGELLMTTGLEFRRSPQWMRAYVRRLVDARVAGLAFGLGPAHATIPPALVRAAASAGLPLLAVPAPTPFLTISRRYWSLLAESGQRELAEMLSVHRALVAAALGGPTVPAVLRRLSLAIGGWAAYLSPDGRVREVWPARRRGSARELQAAVRRLDAVGAPTALSLPLGEDDIVVQPLGGRRLLGYLAVGHARPIPRGAQQLAMTAVALLTLEQTHERRLRLASSGAQGVVLALLRDGHVAAARSAAASIGVSLPDRARFAVLAGAGHAEMSAVLGADPAARSVLSGPLDDGWCVVASADADTGWLTRAGGALPELRAAVGPITEIDHAAAALRRVGRAAASASAGEVVDLAATPDGPPFDSPRLRVWAERRLAPLLADGQDELLATLIAYLRTRSDQRAARELGVHRHTVRNRLGRLEALLDADLADPGTAAELWIALRLAAVP